MEMELSVLGLEGLGVEGGVLQFIINEFQLLEFLVG